MNQIQFINFLPVKYARKYPHRVFKDFYYTDEVRELIAQERCSWVINRIFALQLDEKCNFKGINQHWELKILPDESLAVFCMDEQGRVVYYEQGISDQLPLRH